MSIFGNIQNGVFSGFGKPYIKLEFDDNTALLDFQKRMNESGEAQEAEFEDGEFKPIEGVKMLSEKDFYNLIEREPKYINLDSEKYNYTNNKIKPITDSNGIIKNAYSFRTPIGEIFCWTDFFHIVSGNSSHQDRTRILPLIKPTLEDPNCIFENGKENYFIKPFITEKGVKIIFAFIPTLKENSRVKTLFERPKKEIYNLYTKGGGNLYQKFDILDGSTTLNGVANQSKPFKVVEFRLPCKVDYYFSDNQIFDKKNLGAAGDFYTVLDVRTRARKEPGELTANKNLKFQKTDSIKNFDVKLFNKDFDKKTDIYEYSTKTINNVKYIELDAKKKHDEKLYTNITVWQPISFNKKENSFICTYYNYDIEIDSKKAKNIKKIGDRYSLFITETYYNQLCNEAVNKDIANLKRYANKENERILKNYSILYKNPRAYNIYMRMFEKSEPRKMIEKNIKDIERVSINGLGAPGDVYLVTDTRKNPRKELDETAAFKKIDIEKFNVNALKALQDSDPLLYEEIKAGINAKTTLSKNNIAEVLKREIIADVKDFAKKDGFRFRGVNLEKEREIEEKTDKLRELGWNNALNPLTDNEVKELQKSDFYKIIEFKPRTFEQKKEMFAKIYNYNSDLGKTANPYLYNNNEIIDCRGLKPTYRILDNYDNFFDVADSKTNFAGFGLTDTKKLISETCRAHWKDCKKIAAHLKGDSLLQSCFNLWHWLRFNIRYEYDKEGREEIRTPLRVWHDRARGVDCDCLSVFSWCVLRCMGYDPVFELVAFKNRPQFSHIFINCDGVVVDRVWFVFNSRPPLVTKRELFRVDLINNLGQLF